MNREEVESRLLDGCAILYRRQKRLIDICVNDGQSLGISLSFYSPYFDGWNVDADYNREGNKGQSKRDPEGLVIPDIVIHTGGEKPGPNRNERALEQGRSTQRREEP
jgi:hypothetical protein